MPRSGWRGSRNLYRPPQAEAEARRAARARLGPKGRQAKHSPQIRGQGKRTNVEGRVAVYRSRPDADGSPRLSRTLDPLAAQAARRPEKGSTTQRWSPSRTRMSRRPQPSGERESFAIGSTRVGDLRWMMAIPAGFAQLALLASSNRLTKLTRLTSRARQTSWSSRRSRRRSLDSYLLTKDWGTPNESAKAT